MSDKRLTVSWWKETLVGAASSDWVILIHKMEEMHGAFEDYAGP